MKKKQTTIKQFEVFRKECLRLQVVFSLTGYKLYFVMEDLGDSYANVTVGEDTSVATLRLTSCVDVDQLDSFDPKRHARHEMVHLMIHRLGWLGTCRYLDDCEIPHEDEKLTHKLTELLKDI